MVLGLGLWSLQATRRLYALNQSLVTRTIPAVRNQLALLEEIPTLVRHEGRAIVLRDRAYQAFHRQSAETFRHRLDRLSELLEGRESREALAAVQARFAEYMALVGQEWEALGRGRPDRALGLSRGAARKSADALRSAVERLLARSQADLEQAVKTAGALERIAQAAALLGLGLSLAVGLGVAVMVSLRIARPIRALSRATTRVTQGQYDVPIVVESRDEVGDLARSFREMARKLGEIETLKQQFFSTISHELRSPVASINGAVELLLRQEATGPLAVKQEKLLRTIQSAADKLLALINQILDLSKLSAGMLVLDLQPTDVRRILDSAAEEVRPLAEEKGVGLTVMAHASGLEIVCDRVRIQQVLVNLLANAVKFTPSGGEVCLTVVNEREHLIVCVEDTGVGIPPDHLQHIFEPYYQVHQGKGGTGLGLAIVKGFIEAHGGRVWAESEEGKGSRFCFLLPRDSGSR